MYNLYKTLKRKYFEKRLHYTFAITYAIMFVLLGIYRCFVNEEITFLDEFANLFFAAVYFYRISGVVHYDAFFFGKLLLFPLIFSVLYYIAYASLYR
jgi:hypothetical protein